MYSPVFGTTAVRNKRPSLHSQYEFTVQESITVKRDAAQ